MKHFGLASLAVSSLLLIGAAHAAMRPHYGGTLRVATSAAPASLDPVDLDRSGALASRNISTLIFDTLVVLDDRGQPQPALATSWRPEPGEQRWQFTMRRGVTFQDGTPLSADRVAASLRVANASWRVVAVADSIVIERPSASPNLPAELSLPRNGIVKRDGNTVLGTGPFTVIAWTPGKKLVLAAFNDHWRGRPFADKIEIDMAQGLREQMLAIDLGREDLVEIAAEQAHRAAAEGRRVETSAPSELMALVFTHDPQSPDEGRLRQALGLSIDRGALNGVLLQGGGEPAGGLLPDWMTGYAFLFPAGPNLAKARELNNEARQTGLWTMSYDAADPAARVIAERAALNARDAGLGLQVTNSAAADVRLVRIPISSLDARVALASLSERLGLAPPTFPKDTNGQDSAEGLYTVESFLLQSQRVIPLLHLRANYVLNANVRNWNASADGGWHLSDAWLSMEKPSAEKP